MLLTVAFIIVAHAANLGLLICSASMERFALVVLILVLLCNAAYVIM